MNKFLVNNSSLANTIEAAVDVAKSIDVSELTEALGKHIAPLPGNRHRSPG